MNNKTILACALLLIAPVARADFDTKLGQVVNDSTGRVIQRHCIGFDEASVAYYPPNKAYLALGANQSIEDLRKAMGLSLEGSFQSGGTTVSGKFSFLNAAAKTEYSQTLNLLFQETGAVETLTPNTRVTLNSMGEATLAGPLADQADRCGHQYVDSVEYSSGILVNLSTNFSSKTKVDSVEGELKIISTYDFEGKFKRIFSELKEVGRFQLNVHGWGRYAAFANDVLLPSKCEGDDCSKLDIPLDENFCRQQPDTCESIRLTKLTLDQSVLSCNTNNSPESCLRAIDTIYGIISKVQNRDSGLDLGTATRRLIKESVPTKFTSRGYVGTYRQDGRIVSAWFPVPLSESEKEIIGQNKSQLLTTIDGYRRDIRDLQNITSFSFIDINARRRAADEILKLQANIQYLADGFEKCSNERVTVPSCDADKLTAYDKIKANPLTPGLKADLLRSKPFDLSCEEVSAYFAIKRALTEIPNPSLPGFIINQSRLDTMKYMIYRIWEYKKTTPKDTENFTNVESSVWENMDCKLIATQLKSLRSFEIDGDKVLIIDPLLSQSHFEKFFVSKPRFKVSQLPANRFPYLRELAFKGGISQSYANLKNFSFLEKLDLSQSSASTLGSLMGSDSLRCLVLQDSKIGRLGISSLFNLEKLDLQGHQGYLPQDLEQLLMSEDVPYLSEVYVSEIASSQSAGRVSEKIKCNEVFTSPGGIQRTVFCNDKREAILCDL